MSGITPMRQGDTYPDAVWHFQDDNGNVKPLPTGTTFQFIIYDPKTNFIQIGAGSWDTTNIAQGMATYSWATGDTATVGNYKCYAKFTTTGGKIGTTDPQDFVVQPITVQQ